jgi:membrane-associated protease RseP (regulator of RpoE activity)
LDGYLIVLIAILAWLGLLMVGQKLKFWEKIHCQMYGPFLMTKTRKGRDMIERVARRKSFWTVYGKISVIVTIGSMVALTAVLIWEAALVFELPPNSAVAPEMMLGLPGINPIIPLWYGILGIAVAIIIHEFAHGILSRVANIKVESLGLLFLIVPMGAFVEPNEEEIKKTTRQHRSRLFAAGPGTNMLAAFITFLIFIFIFAPAVKPVSPGAIVSETVSGSPAEEFGLSAWSEIISVNNATITKASELTNLSFAAPGDPVYVYYLYNGEWSSAQIPYGVVISSVTSGLPADEAGIEPGMIVASLNDTVINSLAEFTSVIQNSSHHDPINITVLKSGYDSVRGKDWFIPDGNITKVTLISKWDYYEQADPDNNQEAYKNISYLGVTSTVMGIYPSDSDLISKVYNNPFSGNLVISSFKLIAMPFLGASPVEGAMANLYEPTGSLAWMPNDVFWILTNSIYWIFWINLMLGLTNALPAVPLDGGYVFRDLLKGFFERVNLRRAGNEARKGKRPLSEATVDRYISAISLSLSLVVLFLILWQLIGPRVV